MARNGKIILAKNIKLDKDYKDVLSYSESQMLSLVNENKVAEANDYSFIKVGENVISVGFTYNTCLQANYIAMQNPNYSNKWFFAFIDEVEYSSNNSTVIHYTIDEHSTWFDYWDPKYCFVVREHVNDDTVGLHTYPEQLEHGEYVIDNQLSSKSFGGINSLVVASTVDLTDETDFPNVAGSIVSNIYSGVKYYYVSSDTKMNSLLTKLASKNKSDSIKSIFIGDSSFFSTEGSGTVQEIKSPTSSRVEFYPFNTQPLTKPTKIGNYTPKNNKLLCFPYSYVLASNNNGSSAIYRYELFKNDSLGFSLIGALTPGMSIRMQPKDYNGVEYNNEEGLNVGKLPICSWDTDVYTNWLTQNGVNIALGVGSSLATIGTGVAMTASGVGTPAGVGMIAGGVTSLITQGNEIYQHSLVPPQAEGNTNNGDVTWSVLANRIYLYAMTIKEEYARILDDYFTRTGYKINRLKIPNITGRTYFNYVQIGDSENIGYSTSDKIPVPKNAMETINNIYRRGTTVWHAHVHVGNYAVDNSIQ